MNETTHTITIDGMTCGHCVKAVEATLRALNGVTHAHVRLGSAEVRIDSSLLARKDLVKAIEDAGYTVTSR